ncbi:MAG TPA: RHS repeat-associated core domain-containing protein, partial [Bacteroidia bacterium]|nr:RHS repeat-associated core domain-containing protein [Bacteroidia bacterium]
TKKTINSINDLYLQEEYVYGSSRVGVHNRSLNLSSPATQENPVDHHTGEKEYELSNHLGNVLSTVSDKRIAISSGGVTTDAYQAILKSSRDYYAFGAQMPGRGKNGSYRYGFNGKEKDDELKGGGNSYDFGARIYDPRLGRWLSTDPLQKKYPGESPYSFAGNSPIVLLDNDGNVKVKCVNIIAADGSTSSITTVDADYIVSKGYGPHLTLKGYDNNYQIDYDVFTTTTIDYSHMKDGKPTITSRAQLKEHSWILEARANLLNKKVIVTKELGDPAGNTDDPLGQFSGNTNPVMSPNAQGISDGKGDETQDWQGGNSEGVRLLF